jgi:hypothetical protein
MRLDPVAHRRKPARALGSLAFAVACVAVFTGLYARAGHQVAVLAVSRVVPEGASVTGTDLTVVRLSSTGGVESIPASDMATVVGRRAAEELEPGTLLATDELVARYSPPAGTSIVGVGVGASQLPASGISPGETVDVILTVPPGDQGVASGGAVATDGQPGTDSATSTTGAQPVSFGAVLVPDATVMAVASAPSSNATTTVVSLLAPSTLAPALADASAAGEAALVIVAPGS